jgi:capsular exopolysaccharide synthesis family protein
MSEDRRDGSPVREWLGLLSRRRWVVVIAVLATTLTAFVVSRSEQRLYRATSTVLVNEQNPVAAVLNLAATTASPPDRYAATQAALARVGQVAVMAIAAAHVPGQTPGGLLAHSSVTANPTADLLSFSVTNPQPRAAQALATAYGEAFTDYRRRLDTSALSAALADVHKKLAQLRAVGQGSSALSRQLTHTMHELESMQALQQSGASAVLVGRAGGASIVQPRLTRNVALGLIAGLALGIALAFLSDALDTRVRSTQELHEQLGLPLLGDIPNWKSRSASAGGRLATLSDPEGASAEAYRILKTNLDITQLQHDVSSIVITSMEEGEGKTTTAANLAVTLARSARHVILVDLDLRSPGVDRIFDLPAQPGLTGVAAGEVSLADALKVVDVHAGTAPVDGGLLEVMTVGIPPPDPGAFLSSRIVAEMLRKLAERCDVLLLDAPPMLRVGDAMAIATRTDAILLVTELNHVLRATVAETRRVLDGCPTLTLGVVATGSNGADRYGYRRNGHRAHGVANA